MAAVRQVVALTDKEIRDALIEKAATAINGKPGGPQIQGSIEVKITSPPDDKQLSAEVSFTRPGH